MSAASRVPILEAIGLSKAFGGALAVNNIGFRVEEGEILGIAGARTAAARARCSTSSPMSRSRADSGRVLFRGAEIQHWPSHKICARGLARTFQRESVFPSLSAIDNVMVAIDAVAPSRPLKERERRAVAALDLVGFPATLHK